MRRKRRVIRVEAVQSAPTAGDTDANIDTVARTLERSSAEIVVYPELFLSGYDTTRLDITMPGAVAIELGDSRLDRLAQLCKVKGRALVAGFAEHDGVSGVYDSTLIIDSDGSRSAVRKSHLFGSERGVFLAGDEIRTVSLLGVSVGIINCFEIEFPEVGRTLAKQGAQLFIAISANMRPYQTDHEIGTRARAIENRLPLVYVNRIGEQDGHEFCGLSRIVDADGSVRQQLDEHTPGSLIADITVGEQPDGNVDMLAQLRPALYL